MPNNLVCSDFDRFEKSVTHYKYSGFKISSFNSKGCAIQLIIVSQISGQYTNLHCSMIKFSRDALTLGLRLAF